MSSNDTDEDIPAHLPANIDFVDVFLNGPGAVDVYYTPTISLSPSLGRTVRIRLQAAPGLQQHCSWPPNACAVSEQPHTVLGFVGLDYQATLLKTPSAMPMPAPDGQGPASSPVSHRTTDPADWEVPDSQPEELLLLPHSVPPSSPLCGPQAPAVLTSSRSSPHGVIPAPTSSNSRMSAAPHRADVAPTAVPQAMSPTPSSTPHSKMALSTASTGTPDSDSWLQRVPSIRFTDMPSDIRQLLLDSDSDMSAPEFDGPPEASPKTSRASPSRSPVRFVKARTPQSGSETEPSTPLSALLKQPPKQALHDRSSPSVVVASPASTPGHDPFGPPPLGYMPRQRQRPRDLRDDIAIPFTTSLRLADDPPSPSPAPHGRTPFVAHEQHALRPSSTPVRTKRHREEVGAQREPRKAKVDGGES
ncbi:hypothetical protein FA95DRAFT_1613726 [Auriscalpium vulgare]|uniref:Uncharacterized protein n=1 Tax=Auriscalpium vulgare TaxID=40419 RepID=A0ACB8R2F0_9AGAM|nr:hypothetical protein FA95DRAFT_1613726 [Auriscalpium vulgare]